MQIHYDSSSPKRRGADRGGLEDWARRGPDPENRCTSTDSVLFSPSLLPSFSCDCPLPPESARHCEGADAALPCREMVVGFVRRSAVLEAPESTRVRENVVWSARPALLGVGGGYGYGSTVSGRP